MDLTTSANLVAFMIVDLSNTAAWRHKATSEVIIRSLHVMVDPSTAFNGEIKFGYLSAVDAANGDFNQIADMHMIRKSDLLFGSIDLGPDGMRCDTKHHFGPIIASSTLFQTDVNLGGPDDPATLTYPSGNGDLVLIVDQDSTGTDAIDVSINLCYETI